jgi:Protein of unknown function (DUF2567)
VTTPLEPNPDPDGEPTRPDPGLAPHPGQGFAPQPGAGPVTQLGPGLVLQPGEGFAPQPGPGFAPQLGPGFAPQPEPGFAPQPEPHRRSVRDWLPEVRWALIVALVVTLLGIPLGLLWSAVAPRVPVGMTAQGVGYAQSPRFEEAVADDGWFVFITAGAGAVLAIAVWVIVRRYRGPVLLVALTIGSVAGAVVASWVGHRMGLAEYQRLAQGAAVGQHFSRPVEVATKRVGLWYGVLPRVQGAVLLQAAVAVIFYTLLAGFHRAPSLRDEDARQASAEPLAGEPISSDWATYPAPPAAPEPPAPGTAAPPPD